MIKEFDNAWAKYQQNLKIIPLPLTCWEFYTNLISEETQFNQIQGGWTDKKTSLDLYKQKGEILVTDVNLRIIFASKEIHKINGYTPEELIGKTPKMFQGKATSKETSCRIGIAVKNQLPFKEVILNYKKNGETYQCHIEAYPKFNSKGKLINYIAFERIAS
ncbi:PAS domain-containing protein [Flavobacterium sp.]|uniref:PAS domain-containing protein n=1 Tax=Flavobacterium sp. TaxID=239 RepID=UPI00286DC04B|nr:PAS domain-containing protein [Flavobacterium sp.]